MTPLNLIQVWLVEAATMSLTETIGVTSDYSIEPLSRDLLFGPRNVQGNCNAPNIHREVEHFSSVFYLFFILSNLHLDDENQFA